ncbi:MAG TPA: FAD-dependent oxidoreductase [Acidimicrobiales bacterium]|nr:FAD-dependent oxidoreductase [Acidimicrobiales bacterium]
MAKPAIISVDDDAAVSAAIGRNLRDHYASEYRILPTTSGAQALDLLAKVALRGQPVALIVTDQKMPEMTGVEFLERAKEHCPGAKLVLLTAYADKDVAIRAINEIGLDYYLMKPWTPPEEQLFPVLDDLLADWRRANPTVTNSVRVVGHRWSERCHEIRTFLARNHVQYVWLDIERDDEARRLQELAEATPSDLPLVLVPDKDALRAPTTLEVASALGLHTSAEHVLYDLCIIGAGPAGLAAAVYGASEGLRTIVVEREAPGGQAGLSAAIENYLGFPKGLSGADLAHRAVAQVGRFGAEMVLARDAMRLEVRGPVKALSLGDDAEIESRAVVVATGVSYRRLDAPGIESVEGRGVYYGASAAEAAACSGEDVYVVGGANSAGQAVLNLAHYARRVVMLVRSHNLDVSMSSYLIERIAAAPNIDLRVRSEVVEARGDGHLEAITIADIDSGQRKEFDTNFLFAFIGAAPRTAWLGDEIARDDKGFVVTGRGVLANCEVSRWPLLRDPFPLETSVPGVFAAGDVRLDSTKRVAAAVGEGAMAVALVHQYLETM